MLIPSNSNPHMPFSSTIITKGVGNKVKQVNDCVALKSDGPKRHMWSKIAINTKDSSSIVSCQADIWLPSLRHRCYAFADGTGWIKYKTFEVVIDPRIINIFQAVNQRSSGYRYDILICVWVR